MITAFIALAAFPTAAANVWIAYLRRHKLGCGFGDALRIGYGPRPLHYLMFKIDVYALNTGARPGAIKRIAIDLEGHHILYWTEVTRTEDNAKPDGSSGPR